MASGSAEESTVVLARLRTLALLVFIGFVVAVYFHYIQGTILHRGYPWNTYLFDPKDRFNDWHNSIATARTLDPYYKSHIAPPNYFPFAYLFFLGGSLFSRHDATLLFLGISLGTLILCVVVFGKIHLAPVLTDRRGFLSAALLIAIMLSFSYPLHFALDRGNLDAGIGALCLLYVTLLRTRYSDAGCVALGVAIALKGYPAAFCLLGLGDRRYRQALLPVAVGLLLTAISLSAFSGGVLHNLSGLRGGLHLYRTKWVLGTESMRYSVDPYNQIRILVGNVMSISAVRLLALYNMLSLLFACICAYFVLFVRASRWRRVSAVCLTALLFPDEAADYKLMVLLPCLLLLMVDDGYSWRERVSTVCFAGLFIPKHYLFNKTGVSISGPISAALLLLLSVTVLADRRAWAAAIRESPARCAWYLFGMLPGGAAFRLRRSSFIDGCWHAAQLMEPL